MAKSTVSKRGKPARAAPKRPPAKATTTTKRAPAKGATSAAKTRAATPKQVRETPEAFPARAKAAAARARAATPSTPVTNIVALPIVRNAVSAFEGAADLLGGQRGDDARKKAQAMRGEYRRLSLLPPERLLEHYQVPRTLKLASLTEAAVKSLLPKAGDQVWAREAAGRLAALSLLRGEPAAIKAPLGSFNFVYATTDMTENREAKARIGAYVEVARDTMLNGHTVEARTAAQRSYMTWLGEWNRLNAAEIEASAAYRPGVEDLQEATKDLEDTRGYLQAIKVGSEILETVLRVIALVA